MKTIQVYFTNICITISLVLTYLASPAQGSQAKVKIPFGHSVGITATDISADGKYIVTGSTDKSVIIWDAATGKEIRTLLTAFPVQEVKISPDTKTLIIATGTEMGIRGGLQYELWNIKTGSLIKTLPFFGSAGVVFTAESNIIMVPNFALTQIQDNIFAPSALTKGLQVTTVDITTGKVLKAYDIGINFQQGEISAVGPEIKFLQVGNQQYFIACQAKLLSRDGEGSVINVWSMQDNSKPIISFPCSGHINSISTASNGMFAASTANKILLWKFGTQNPVDSFISKGNYVNKIALTADGKLLWSYSTVNTKKSDNSKRTKETVIESWNLTGNRQPTAVNKNDSLSLRNLCLAPDNKYFIQWRGKNAYAFDYNGSQMFTLGGYVMPTKPFYFSAGYRYATANPRRPKAMADDKDDMTQLTEMAKSMGVSQDMLDKMIKMTPGGTNIKKTNNADPEKPVVPNFPALDMHNADIVLTARVKAGMLFNGTTIPVTTDTVSDNNIKIINNQGIATEFTDINNLATLANAPQLNGIMDMVNPILKDVEQNTKIKTLVNTETRDTLSLIFLKDNEWIILYNKGYYKASKNAAALLHYVSNNDKIISFEQLDLLNNRPDLILKALGSNNTPLIEAYKKTYDYRLASYGINNTTFNNDDDIPEADFSNRNSITYNQANQKLIINIHGKAARSALRRLNVWINEVPVFGTKGLQITARTGNFDTSITISLSNGRNKIETNVRNNAGYESYRYPLFVNYNPVKPATAKTWFIGIGVNKYADAAHNNLKYTIDDIRSVVTALKNKNIPDFMVDTLFNKNFTVNNLTALKSKLAGAGINDKVILFYSGHGVLGNDGKYYFPVSSMNTADFTNPAATAVSYDYIESLLEAIPARNKLFLIDACHSGLFSTNDETLMDSTTTSQLMDDVFTYVGRGTGTTVVASSSGPAKSLESTLLKHGFFTQAVLDATETFNTITVSELKKSVLKRVPELSNYRQIPSTRSENREADFKIW